MLVYQRVYIYTVYIYIFWHSIWYSIWHSVWHFILYILWHHKSGILSDVYSDIIMEKMETTGFKRFSQVLTLGSTCSIGQIPLISTAFFLLEKNTMDFPQNDQSQSQMDFVLGFLSVFEKQKQDFRKLQEVCHRSSLFWWPFSWGKNMKKKTDEQ